MAPYVPTAHAPYPWYDGAGGGTPLDATDLMAAEDDGILYTQQEVLNVANRADAGDVVVATSVTAEATARALADTAEATARSSAVTALGAAIVAAQFASAQALARTAVKTANYTAAPGDAVPWDISGGSRILTLPTAPADRTRIAAKIVTISGTPGSTTLTIAAGGSDVFNKAAGSTTLTLTALNQGVILQYDHATSVWQVQATDTPLGVPLGAAKIAADGTIGGVGGTPLVASPIDGQLVGWNATLGLYVPVNPAGGTRLAYAQNVTGTATAASATSGALGAAVAVPGCAITIPASNGKNVILEMGGTFQQTTAGLGQATLAAYNGGTEVAPAFAELPNLTATPACYVMLLRRKDIGVLAAPLTVTLYLQLWADTGSAPAGSLVNNAILETYISAVTV